MSDERYEACMAAHFAGSSGGAGGLLCDPGEDRGVLAGGAQKPELAKALCPGPLLLKVLRANC